MTVEAFGLAAVVRRDTGVEECRLAALFDVHHGRLYRLARRLTASPDDAKDLVQETFLRVARAPLAVPHGPSSEEAWLVRILVNLCRDTWRRRGRQRAAAETGALAPAIQASHEEAFVAHVTVWRALRTLPPRQRAVVVLHELDDISVADVAKLLGISAVTVRWHLSVARRVLARTLRKDGGRG